MNKHSLIYLVSLFFLLLFVLINGLFSIAHAHYTKEQVAERMHRFALADRLVHERNEHLETELRRLMIEISPLSPDELRWGGDTLIQLPFGEIIRYGGLTYFVKSPPPHFRFGPPPPNFPMHTDVMGPPPMFPPVLKDLKTESSWPILGIFAAVDLMMLLFFAYLMRKLLPLHRLRNAISSFKEGDTALDIPIGGEDEISQITREFNHALEKIASMKEARSLFLRNVLHELKTPIMKGSLTAECFDQSPDRQRLMRIFDRMGYLLDEFARMERFSSGEWNLNLQEYRFVDLLDHACDILVCDKKKVIIKGEYAPLILKADFELFAIALKNLLDNALKYGTLSPSVIILSHTVEICSIGDPIPESKRDFTKPFNRTYEDSSAGLGLGLYLSDSILRRQGFRLEYRYLNGMNCFRIVL